VVERVLALDMSTKTGWALIESGSNSLELLDYGQFVQMAEPKDVPYPESYVDWANAIVKQIRALVTTHTPDILVIEETASGSKSNYSQKILEFIHYLVAFFVKTTGIRTRYFLTEEWRRICACKMTKEESKRNKDVRDYKKKHGTKLAKSAEGKVIGRIGRKHINVRRANEIFEKYLDEPLRKKDEDAADAMLLGAAYHLSKNAKPVPTTKSALKGLRENGKAD
jgi:Holliday junction resolvasome RuvABC endonuclease subunit